MRQEQSDRNADPSSEPLSTRADRDHVLAAPMLRFDLRAETERLQQQESYRKRDPTGRTLVKEPNLRIVLMALQAGAKMEEHQASGPISLHVLQGRLRLRLLADSVELTAEELLMLEPGVLHDVEASEDAIFLLTIGRTTYDRVSDRHER
jgi:quercetin dioxygenase-like cupin family protein